MTPPEAARARLAANAPRVAAVEALLAAAESRRVRGEPCSVVVTAANSGGLLVTWSPADDAAAPAGGPSVAVDALSGGGYSSASTSQLSGFVPYSRISGALRQVVYEAERALDNGDTGSSSPGSEITTPAVMTGEDAATPTDAEGDKAATLAAMRRKRARRAAALGSLAGTRLRVQVLRLDVAYRRVVFTAEDPGRVYGPATLELRARVAATLTVGEVVAAKVTALEKYGAFVRLVGSGADALVPACEIAWSRPKHPHDLLTPGQDVRAQVMALSPEQGRIILSIRALLPDPLLESLESLVGRPGVAAIQTGAPLGDAPEGVPLICSLLLTVPGVASATPGRCFRTAAFAPSLQLLLAAEAEPAAAGTASLSGEDEDEDDPAADHRPFSFTAVARAGNAAQEIFVAGWLTRVALKDALQSVLRAYATETGP